MNINLFNKKQDNGDFLKEDRWHNWKVLRGCGNPEKILSGTSQQKTAKKVLLDQAIHTTRATHGGRHTGTMEAEALVIPLDLIKRGGGWKDRLDRLETHYLEIFHLILQEVQLAIGISFLDWQETACRHLLNCK